MAVYNYSDTNWLKHRSHLKASDFNAIAIFGAWKPRKNNDTISNYQSNL